MSRSDPIFPVAPAFSKQQAAAASARVPRSSAAAAASADASAGVGAWSVLALCGLSLCAGAAAAYHFARRRALARDSPPSMSAADLPAVWERILKEHESRASAKKQTATASSSSSSSAASAATAASSSVDVSSLILRDPTLADLDAVTAQTVESFDSFNASVGLGPEFPPGLEAAILRDCIQHDSGLIAVDSKGAVMGAVFNDETDIAEGAVGGGPWSSKWGALQAGIGKALIVALCSRSIRHGARSLRLIQVSANNVSLALYSSLGFESREPLLAWKGLLRKEFCEAAIARGADQGFTLRPMTAADVDRCDAMHVECNGISRAVSMRKQATTPGWGGGAVGEGMFVAMQHGKIVGFITGTTATHCTVATSLEAVQFLYASVHSQLHASGGAHAKAYQHTCLRLYPELTRWLLSGGFKICRQVNLMVLGEWQPIAHERFVYCPSIMY